MISKNEVKYIQSLHHKKTREEERLFIAEGPKLIEELLHSNFRIKKIYGLAEWAQQHGGINTIEVTAEELQRISGQPSPNSVVAIVEERELPVLHIEDKLVLMLDAIRDPGNLGTIIRIADWFGLDTIIASPDTAEVYNPKVVQASMGSIARVNVYYLDLIATLSACPLPIYGAMLSGKNVQDVGKIEQGIIIIGNEATGISGNIAGYIQTAITIPQKGRAESLNAAVAAGIILSHVV